MTIDEELARALDEVDPSPPSRSRLVRDLALRGAQAMREDRDGSGEALKLLLEIADGDRHYDLSASASAFATRGDRLP